MENKKHSALAVAIVALIIGVTGGFFIGNMTANKTDTKDGTMASERVEASNEANDLRVGLNNLLTEHVDLAAPALRAVFDESEDADAAVAALDENSVELAGAIGSVYGEEAEQDFLELWRAHIGFFADFTVAAREGNQEGVEQAQADLDGYVSEASAFFAEATGLPQDALAEGLDNHVQQVFGIAGAWAEGNWSESYQLQREATDHMSMTADTLSQGIVESNPELF